MNYERKMSSIAEPSQGNYVDEEGEEEDDED